MRQPGQALYTLPKSGQKSLPQSGPESLLQFGSEPKGPESGLAKRLESLVRKAAYNFHLLENVDHVAVALSGGKDSLTLLTMLLALRGRGFPTFSLSAIHVDGVFSCGAGVQIDFLRAFCEARGVPLHVRHSTQTRENLACYSCSRERRLLLFDAAKSIGATTIAFGHHQCDCVQTFLLNLFHKGEAEGMLPKVHMYHYGVTIIRPLVYIAEAQIREFAIQQGFARVTCRCPVGEHSMRMQVENMLKEMEKHFPHIRSNLASVARRISSGKAGDQPKSTIKNMNEETNEDMSNEAMSEDHD